jgi:hypothetical protein
MIQSGLPFGREPSRLERAFLEFHHNNPKVYELFCHFARQALDAHRTRLSAKLLWERIRWYTTVETTDPEWKLNNNHHAYYARLWLADHPDRPDFFRLRRTKGESRCEDE